MPFRNRALATMTVVIALVPAVADGYPPDFAWVTGLGALIGLATYLKMDFVPCRRSFWQIAVWLTSALTLFLYVWLLQLTTVQQDGVRFQIGFGMADWTLQKEGFDWKHEEAGNNLNKSARDLMSAKAAFDDVRLPSLWRYRSSATFFLSTAWLAFCVSIGAALKSLSAELKSDLPATIRDVDKKSGPRSTDNREKEAKQLDERTVAGDFIQAQLSHAPQGRQDVYPYDVFLSHSSKDKSAARDVAERLSRDGLKVWWDEWEIKPGDSIPSKIDDGLELSRIMVLFMSANAFGSDWSKMEANIHRFNDPLNKRRRLVPLRLDDAPIKGALVQFRHIRWLPADRITEYPKLLEACRHKADPG